MRLLDSIQHKSCADGSYMKEYRLDTPLTKEFFDYLKNFGRVEALVVLDDEYYNFEKQNCFSIKGFIGESTVEVRFKREVMDVTTGFLRLLFSSFKPDVSLPMLKEREKSCEAVVKKMLNL